MTKNAVNSQSNYYSQTQYDQQRTTGAKSKAAKRSKPVRAALGAVIHDFASIGSAASRTGKSFAEVGKAVKQGEAGTSFNKTVSAGFHLGSTAALAALSPLNAIAGTGIDDGWRKEGKASGTIKPLDKGAIKLANEAVGHGIGFLLGGVGAMLGTLGGSVEASWDRKNPQDSRTAMQNKIKAGRVAGQELGEDIWNVLTYVALKPTIAIARVITGLASVGLMALAGVIVGGLSVLPASLVAVASRGQKARIKFQANKAVKREMKAAKLAAKAQAAPLATAGNKKDGSSASSFGEVAPEYKQASSFVPVIPATVKAAKKDSPKASNQQKVYSQSAPSTPSLAMPAEQSPWA